VNAFFEAWFGVSLRDASLLTLALPVPVMFMLRLRRRAPAVTFAPAGLLRCNPDGTSASLPRSWRTRFAALPTVLLTLGILLAVIALARPVQRVPLPVKVQGIDVVLCIDVSSSMAAVDLDGQRTRLAVARTAAREFVGSRPHDRIGLVQFARFPDVLCPPTLDHEALGQFLNVVELVERDGPEDRTGIGIAVARAVQVLDSSQARSKIVILVTDGEENVASAGTPDEIGPLQAGQLALHHDVRVYTIAVGQVVRGPGGRMQQIDSSQVRELAESSGGRSFTAASASGVRGIYAEIAGLERVEFLEPEFRLEERFLLFLLPAVLCLVLGWILRATLLEVQP